MTMKIDEQRRSGRFGKKLENKAKSTALRVSSENYIACGA
jgi:hypothetical protein